MQETAFPTTPWIPLRKTIAARWGWKRGDCLLGEVSTLSAQPGEGEQPQVLTPDTPDAAATPTPTPAPSVSQEEPSPTPAPPEPFVRGVAAGSLRSGVSLDLPSDARVSEGDLVVTSGLGGNYPRSLLIGTIESVTSRPQSPFTRTTLEPAADLSRLDTVLVLMSFRPARLESP